MTKKELPIVNNNANFLILNNTTVMYIKDIEKQIPIPIQMMMSYFSESWHARVTIPSTPQIPENDVVFNKMAPRHILQLLYVTF